MLTFHHSLVNQLIYVMDDTEYCHFAYRPPDNILLCPISNDIFQIVLNDLYNTTIAPSLNVKYLCNTIDIISSNRCKAILVLNDHVELCVRHTDHKKSTLVHLRETVGIIMYEHYHIDKLVEHLRD